MKNPDIVNHCMIKGQGVCKCPSSQCNFAGNMWPAGFLNKYPEQVIKLITLVLSSMYISDYLFGSFLQPTGWSAE